MRQLNYSEKIISPELRTFALTLHFYSPSAYNYVKDAFNKSLPHPSTIKKWYSTVDGAPGFTEESFKVVRSKVTEKAQKNKKLVCGIIVDEMSIRDDLHFNGKRLQGYINFGLKTTENAGSVLVAKEVIVFLIVALNSHWKIPVGYFLIGGLNAPERAKLVNT